jgi:hypothetical protein
MSDETIVDDLARSWNLRRGSATNQARFHLDISLDAEWVNPTRDEVRNALTQCLDEALGPEPDLTDEPEIAGWLAERAPAQLTTAERLANSENTWDDAITRLDSYKVKWSVAESGMFVLEATYDEITTSFWDRSPVVALARALRELPVD